MVDVFNMYLDVDVLNKRLSLLTWKFIMNVLNVHTYI